MDNETIVKINESLNSFKTANEFLNYMEQFLMEGTANISEAVKGGFLQRAAELRCKTDFQKMWKSAKNRADYTGNIPEYVIFNDSGKAVVSPELLSRYIEQKYSYFFVQSKETEDPELFWYRSDAWIFSRISKTVAKAKIKSIICDETEDEKLATSRAIEETFKQLTYTESSQHYLESDNELNIYPSKITFITGVYDLDTDTFTGVGKPEYRSTVQIPCNWLGSQNESWRSKETPVFDRFIEHLANGDEAAKQTLLEMIGFCVSNLPIRKFKKSLFLVGEGNCGKSQYIGLINKLLGSENVCTLPFSRLEDRFSISAMYGKRFTADPDCRSVGGSEISVFKELTGGDLLYADRKGKTQLQFTYRGLYLVCANRLPKFGGDKGRWVYERILPIQCGAPVPEEEQDKDLLDKMYKEKDGIVYKAIAALRTAIANNYKFTIGEASKALLSQYMTNNDVTLRFIEECCTNIEDNKQAMSTADVWTAFTKWCEITGEYRPTRTEFNLAIAMKYNIPDYKKVSKQIHGGRRVYPFTLSAEAKEELHIFDSIE